MIGLSPTITLRSDSIHRRCRLQQSRRRMEEQGGYDLAIADYNTAIKLDKNYVNAYSNRAVALYRKGEMIVPLWNTTMLSGLLPMMQMSTIIVASLLTKRAISPSDRRL